MDREQFLDLMARDKKVQNGELKLVLMRGIGQSVVTGDYPADKLIAQLDAETAQSQAGSEAT
jgi:3-dehydroquinate synthase